MLASPKYQSSDHKYKTVTKVFYLTKPIVLRKNADSRKRLCKSKKKALLYKGTLSGRYVLDEVKTLTMAGNDIQDEID